MSETATLSSMFQISIPKAIRTAQAWEVGLTFAFIPKGTGVLLVPVPKQEALKGIARGASVTDTVIAWTGSDGSCRHVGVD